MIFEIEIDFIRISNISKHPILWLDKLAKALQLKLKSIEQ